MCFFVAFAANTQTTVYTTGQTYPDAWTGWSTPVVTGITSSSVNGAYIYNFNGTASTAFTVETYRQFTINSNDLDFYLTATTQNATVSIEYSTDNVSYSQIGTQNWGAGFAVSTLIVPTFDPVVTTFYIKLKMVGTFGSPSQTNFNSLKIDAVLNSANSVSIAPTATQTIATSTNGTMLTASEAPSAATSREWKYSSTSGSGYVSFGVAETGTTYTPNFAVNGTYYVVCESNFSGDVQTSNEVQINVSGSIGIDAQEINTSVIYSNQLLEIRTNALDYQVQIYNIQGQIVFTQNNLKTYDFGTMEEGIYFVTVIYNGERKTWKIANVR